MMNSAHLAWYALALLGVVVAACVNAGFDAWLLSLSRPWPLRAYVLLAARWGFWCAVISYAYLIDSFKVPFSEWGVAALLALGVGLVAALTWLRGRP